MLYKALPEIQKNDLDVLVANKVKEGSRLDYKLVLPGGSDAEKKDFLQDIAALANTTGGDIIYGIREGKTNGKANGVAEELVGIKKLNANQTQLTMEQLILSSIEPRLTGVEFREIAIDDEKSALIIRVPNSWNSPHVVSYGNRWRFYARNSAGNYSMDVNQLRDAFQVGNQIADRLDDRRDDRVEKIRKRYVTGKVEPHSVLVVHLQPFESLRADNQVDCIAASSFTQLIMLGGEQEKTPAYNFDGLIVKQGDYYFQLFRSGFTEDVIVGLKMNLDSGVFLNAYNLDQICFRTLGSRLALAVYLGQLGPAFVHISLLGVGGLKLRSKQEMNGQLLDISLPTVADRPDLIAEPIFVESLGNLPLAGSVQIGTQDVPNYWLAAKRIMKPALDSFWNGFGIERSLHYDESGEFRGYLSSADAFRFRFM